MAKFVKYENGGVSDNLKKKFETAGYKSNAEGTKFTKGNRVYSLNKDGSFNLVDKSVRKDNVKKIAKGALRTVAAIATIGGSEFGSSDNVYGSSKLRKGKFKNLNLENVDRKLTREQEIAQKKAEIQKAIEERKKAKKEKAIKNQEQRLADNEAEKKAKLKRKEDNEAKKLAEEAARLKATEEETRKKAEAEALKQKQAQEDELKKQQEAEKLAPFADDIANFKRTPTGEVAHIDALPEELKAKYMEQIQAKLQEKREGAIQMLSPEDFLKENIVPKATTMSKKMSSSFQTSTKDYGIDSSNWTPGQIVTSPSGVTKILVDVRRVKGKVGPNQQRKKIYYSFMDFKTEETKEKTFNEAYRDAIKGGLKPGDTFEFKGNKILIEDDPGQTPEESEAGERRKEVTTETRKLSEDINKARLNKTGKKGMIARFKK